MAMELEKASQVHGRHPVCNTEPFRTHSTICYMGVRAFGGSLELVSHTVQPGSSYSMDLSAQAEELRQSISALYGGTCGISCPYPVSLATRSATSVNNGDDGRKMRK